MDSQIDSIQSESLWNTLLNNPSSPKKQKKTHFIDLEKSQPKIPDPLEDNLFDFGEEYQWINIEEPEPNFLQGIQTSKSQMEKQFLGQNERNKLEQPQRKNKSNSIQFSDIDHFLEGQAFESETSKNITSHIFCQSNLKRRWKKNTNVPKFIVRIYLKHFNRFNEKKDFKFKNIFKKVKTELEQRKTNNYNITDILKFFDYPQISDQEVFSNSRRVMSMILASTLQDQIIKNHSINENKLSYMIATKIYAIRCRSRHLVDRVKVF